MKKHRVWVVIIWLLGLYVAAYLVFCVLGYFDLVKLPWNNQEDGFLYRAFFPLEWLRRAIMGQ
jgi:hypothetical protein